MTEPRADAPSAPRLRSGDLGPLLAAVRDDWERGKVIAERAGIDSRTAGPRLAALAREGLVATSWTERHGGVRLYRRGPKAEGIPRLPTEHEALLSVERAARELDALFDGKPGCWTLGGWRVVNDDVSEALLSLHDYLNDVEVGRHGLAR